MARLGSLRLLIVLSASFGMLISQLDITAAYLHSDTDSVVHMETSEHLEEMLIRITLVNIYEPKPKQCYHNFMKDQKFVF